MLTPSGEDADKIDKIMLLSMWADALKKESESTLVTAGMGKPTYPLFSFTSQYMRDYWSGLMSQSSSQSSSSLTSVAEGTAITYGVPQGDDQSRHKMAQAMSAWYDCEVLAEDLLFTVGGAAAIHVIFKALKDMNADCPHFRVLTVYPYYTLYQSQEAHLHSIDVMKAPGYQLTATLLEQSIEEAYRLAALDGGDPRALLLCEPNNPLSTVIDKQELSNIAQLLTKYPQIKIILDEAYAEMVLDGSKHRSLYSEAPALRDRIVVMRSATKALSAAGERMAFVLCKNTVFMNKLVAHHIHLFGHAPRSLQAAYAETMLHFSADQRRNLLNFYRLRVDYVFNRLQQMGAWMPDAAYKPQSTFYVLADLSDLLGTTLPSEAARALSRSGLVKTDEDMVYALLFKSRVMLAPMSYFGLDATLGFVRITCSDNLETLQWMMDKIEQALTAARALKLEQLKTNIQDDLDRFKSILGQRYDLYRAKLRPLVPNLLGLSECLQLKIHYAQLIKAQKDLLLFIKQQTELGRSQAALKIQSIFRGRTVRRDYQARLLYLEGLWRDYVDEIAPKPCVMRSALLTMPKSERMGFKPWRDYLEQKSPTLTQAL